MMPRPLSTARLLLKILQDSRAFLGQLGLLLFFSVAAIPFAILLPLPLKIVVDYALQGKAVPAWIPPAWSAPATLIAVACGFEFLILFFKGTVSYGIWLYQIYVEQMIVADGRARLFRHVQNLSLQKHDQRGIADLFYRLQNDIGTMHAMAVNGLIPLASTVLTFVAMFVIAFRLDAPLALMAMAVLPATWSIGRLHLPGVRKSWREVKDSDQQALGVIQEVLGAIRVVRAFSQEDREVKRFLAKAAQKTDRVLAAGLKEAVFGTLVAATVAVASAAAIYLGARHVQEGRLTLGNFLIITTYLVQLFRPLDYVSRQTSTVQAALVSAERYFALLDEIPDIRDAANPHELGRAKGGLEFRDVSFAYLPGANVIQKVSFSVRPGQRVGIIGSTGAGKTTLISLLMRFLDPSAGTVLLDGTDFRQFRLRDLRRQFSIVLQEPVLFSGTIAENIAYGRPDAPAEEIERAARLAEAHEFITGLADGYRTQVGERGMSLSGGERQRISLARAFLMDAPILVMDEPTSNLDLKHEMAIRAALLRLKEGRTTFTISHRPSLLEGYDLILRVQDGLVTEVAGAAGA